MYRLWVIYTRNFQMYCDFVGKRLTKNFFVQNQNFFFQNVEVDELITNHQTSNYLACTVTELFGLVTCKCILIFGGGGSPKILLSKIKISYVFNVQLDELITNHPTGNYPSFAGTELFGLVTFKCIVNQNFFVHNQNFFCS